MTWAIQSECFIYALRSYAEVCIRHRVQEWQNFRRRKNLMASIRQRNVMHNFIASVFRLCGCLCMQQARQLRSPSLIQGRKIFLIAEELMAACQYVRQRPKLILTI